MSSLSKCFYEASVGRTCRDLWHPQFASCWHYIFDLWKRIMPGSFKLYIPLLVLPPLVKSDGVTGAYLMNHFLEYVYISIATYVQAALSLTFQCGFSNLFGYLNYWCIMFWPCLLGVACGPKLPQQHLRLQGITFFNMMVETMIRKSRVGVIQYLRSSRVFGTFSFMILSAIIMTKLHSGVVKQFWLINPPELTGDTEAGRCSHKRTCRHFLLDGMVKYAMIGFILETVRALITKFSLLMTDRSAFLTEFTAVCSTKLGLFLAFYVGIYRATCCLLTRNHLSHFGSLQSTLAGFLAGCAYWMYPKYQVYTLAFTKTIEMSWEYWMKTGQNIPPFVERLNRLSFVYLAQMLSFGYLGHIYAFHPHLSPSFHIKAMDFCSKNLTLGMRRRIMLWILGHGA
ncbi:uncharacterized protein LOC129734064 [Wyeomyia smithii]|uniref:uncharacterized protein LOC129734064 n=1 Tax=Wyeomyia smithii TaxID=174621 RepID=UPI002467AE72|nr:uncharacterized protein LOC129734064 [Wyeomyia smithii]